ncbi:hypothetical protein HKX48_003481 [Thoreauomyces humboldtii]|nr:hypothetical protein HKX48_003481 [Thoreauomyces humboldtii]
MPDRGPVRHTLAIARHADIVNTPKWKLKELKALRNGLRATVYMTNGDRYIGEWKEGMKDGNGTYHYAGTGAVYQGEWSQDLRSGYGTYSVPTTTITDPHTARSSTKPHTSSNSGTPRSALLPSLPSLKQHAATPSQGSRRSTNDNQALRKVYAGSWQYDLRHGRGTCFYDDGSVYDGMWENDVRQGWGQLSFASDSSVYEGEWHDGLRHGQGVLLLANGDRYEGTYLNDLKEGPGRFIYRQKRQCYEGEWALDMPKCGTLTDLPPLAGQEGKKIGARNWWPIPKLELENPSDVLAGEREAILRDRLRRVLHGDEEHSDDDAESLPEE